MYMDIYVYHNFCCSTYVYFRTFTSSEENTKNLNRNMISSMTEFPLKCACNCNCPSCPSMVCPTYQQLPSKNVASCQTSMTTLVIVLLSFILSL